MDFKEISETPREWVKEGTRFFNRCEKPTADEYRQICRAVATGFAIMGVIGYLVKLVHVPIK